MALGPAQLAILCRLADGPDEGLSAHGVVDPIVSDHKWATKLLRALHSLGAVAPGQDQRWLITASGRRAVEAARAHESWRAKR
jgi:hypothetical protein